jgi:hypothetical protein
MEQRAFSQSSTHSFVLGIQFLPLRRLLRSGRNWTNRGLYSPSRSYTGYNGLDDNILKANTTTNEDVGNVDNF